MRKMKENEMRRGKMRKIGGVGVYMRNGKWLGPGALGLKRSKPIFNRRKEQKNDIFQGKLLSQLGKHGGTMRMGE